MTLEENIDQLLSDKSRSFSEPALPENSQNEFGMGFPRLGGLAGMTKVGGSNIVVFALGSIFSDYIKDAAARFIPSGYDKFAAIIGGFFIIFLGRSSAHAKAFGTGVMIKGLADLYGQKVRGYFNEPAEFKEDRMTYGGTDGVYPTQPERRVFS